MKFIQTPVKGMQDFLPEDMALRQHVLGLIRETYGRYGFTEIETPVMEHIENLTGKNGGENEKLIFKVEKRGRELEKALGKVRGSEDMPSDAAGTETASSGATGQNAAAAGQAVKTRILNIPSSLNTGAWVTEIGKYMKKAWNDPDQMEAYCRALAGVINHKLDVENHVPDTQAPVITLEKDSFSISDADSAPDYLEGAKATDDYDGDITDQIAADDSEVKYGTPGTYQVRYSVTDAAGNTGEAAASVMIQDQTAPELQLAKTEFRMQVGDDKPDYLSYASSRDANDGDLTALIKVDDSGVDYGSAGSYTIRFSVADAAGNEASKDASLVIEKKPEPEPVVREPLEEEDSGYNYIVNKKTGVFHYPNCRGVGQMNESNKIYSSKSRDELREKGYKPCGICNP